jgi:hypothetical protein
MIASEYLLHLKNFAFDALFLLSYNLDDYYFYWIDGETEIKIIIGSCVFCSAASHLYGTHYVEPLMCQW